MDAHRQGLTAVARLLLAGAGLAGAVAVGLGAWAAHGLEAAFGPRAVALVNTGVSYQLWHALAVLAAVLLHRLTGARLLAAAGLLFLAGIVLFSGSLYGLAFGLPGWLGAVAPLGGASLIAGWCMILIAALAGNDRRR